MYDKYTAQILTPLLWLLLAAGLLGMICAASYDEAMSILADGEYRAANRVFKRLALEGHPEAQYQLGMLLLLGKGVDMDVEQGIEWLKRATDNGFYLAANELGRSYILGRGVAPDEEGAKKWLERASQLAEQQPDDAEEDCE
jgi:TPR repeat protein